MNIFKKVIAYPEMERADCVFPSCIFPSNVSRCIVLVIVLILSGVNFESVSATPVVASSAFTDTSLSDTERNIADEIDSLREENLSSFRSRLKVIWICLCIVVSLLLCNGIILYHYRESKRGQQECQLVIAELKGERECMRHETSQLKKALCEQENLETSAKIAVNSRLSMLNGLLVSEITGNKSHAITYARQVESIHRNRSEFIESTKQTYLASYPRLRKYLDKANLDESEKSIICLYALGLRGKEIIQYTRIKSIYNISSSIRKKLGINEHETNLGLYIRDMLKNLT